MSESWAQARNVLAIRLDAMGDVLMTGPALRALKGSTEDRRVTLLTSPAGAEAAALIREVDEVLVYEAPWMKATPPRSNAGQDHDLIDELRRRRFDAAVIFTVYSQSPLPAAVYCYLAGIPERLAHCRENAYQLLTLSLPETEPHPLLRHEVRRQLDLVAAIGCSTGDERLSVHLPRTSLGWAEQQLKDMGRRWLIMHPGASAASRRYPVESFIEVGQTLSNRYAFEILVTGSASERELAETVARGIGPAARPLAGGFRLAEFAALIARAPVIVTNNTGTAHLAAATQTPQVNLYALTNPQHTPWQAPCRVLSHDVPCRNCYKSICPEGHHDCLRKVLPRDVVKAVLELVSLRSTTHDYTRNQRSLS